MSDIPADYRDQLDLRAIIARIDRDRAEGLKLQEEREKFRGEREKMLAEQERMLVEQSKLMAEQHKLMAEGNRFNRDKWILPTTAIISAFGLIVAGIIARLPEILRALGWSH